MPWLPATVPSAPKRTMPAVRIIAYRAKSVRMAAWCGVGRRATSVKIVGFRPIAVIPSAGTLLRSSFGVCPVLDWDKIRDSPFGNRREHVVCTSVCHLFAAPLPHDARALYPNERALRCPTDASLRPIEAQLRRDASVSHQGCNAVNDTCMTVPWRLMRRNRVFCEATRTSLLLMTSLQVVSARNGEVQPQSVRLGLRGCERDGRMPRHLDGRCRS